MGLPALCPRLTSCLALLLLVLAGIVKPARAQASRDAAMACEKLATFQPASVYGHPLDFDQIVDAPTHIAHATIVPPADGVPAYCNAEGYVSRNVGIAIHMPLHSWNGKFAMSGCGGTCGAIQPHACDTALIKGYSCIFTDMGHQSTGTDSVWAYNNTEALVDFGFRATHVAALAGKAITLAYYGVAPKLSYFMGCSTGGRQGYVEAERFPTDFDGILAGAPPLSESGDSFGILNAILALSPSVGKPLLSSKDLQLVNHAALDRCDAGDGLKDGVIADPTRCDFDPHTLVCSAGSTTDCLTSVQADAVQKVYDGPRDSRGKRVYRGFMRGSELGWEGALVRDDGQPANWAAFMLSQNRFLNFNPAPGPNWQFKDFDFDRDPQRTLINEALFTAANPDFTRFRDHGGKFLSFQGWNDYAVEPQATTDFYELVERQMGGPVATQSFFRLFMEPGLLHCQGGTGPYARDFLTALEDWVERGQAPDRILSVRPKDPNGGMYPNLYTPIEGTLRNRLYARPLLPYPAVPVYDGHGDPSSANSFVPAQQ